jgi:hypothetical protein
MILGILRGEFGGYSSAMNLLLMGGDVEGVAEGLEGGRNEVVGETGGEGGWGGIS